MRVCFFGTYTMQEGYPVNRVVLEGLLAAGFEVVQCHADLWRDARDRWSGQRWFLSAFFWTHTIRTYLELIFKYLRIGPYDLMVVGYLGHHDIFLARLFHLFKRRPLVLIAFNSLYETVVQDRGLFTERSLAAAFLHWLDRTACRLADLVLLDTQAHIDYFVKEFNLPPSKFLRVFVGSSLAAPSVASTMATQIEPAFEVLFIGTYIPLHGIETILRAAKLLDHEQDVQFTLIGRGQLYPQMREKARRLGLSRVRFIDRWIPGSELIEWLIRAGICLGVFGRSEKTQRVIPCKAFDCLAMGRPLITADTPAARELLVHGENASLTPPGDDRALADAILHLKNDPDLRQRIASRGYETYRKVCTPSAVGELLKRAFNKLTETTAH